MFHLADNRFGPAGNLPMDLTQTGILAMQKQNLRFIELSTLDLAIPDLNSPSRHMPPVLSLNFNFGCITIHHENVGIVYMKRIDAAGDATYGELFQTGLLSPRDAVTRNLVINGEQWDELNNKGGIELTEGAANPTVKIYFVFAAWHRENPMDPDSPWIQNDIKPLTFDGQNTSLYGEITTTTISGTRNEDGNTREVSFTVPYKIKFSYEDMTGPRDEWLRDNDYNDMEITATFNWGTIEVP